MTALGERRPLPKRIQSGSRVCVRSPDTYQEDNLQNLLGTSMFRDTGN